MPDVVRSCEMKAISSKEDWTWQRMLTSCPQNLKHEMAAGFGRTGGCSDTSLDYWLVEMSVRKRCGMWLGCESARLRRAVICNLWYDASGVEVQKTIKKRSVMGLHQGACKVDWSSHHLHLQCGITRGGRKLCFNCLFGGRNIN